MKHTMKTCVVILIVLFMTSNAVYGQLGFKKGIKLGYNMATLAGDNLDDAETLDRFMAGVSLEFSILGIFALQTDVLYSPQGARFQNQVDTKLNYISIPVLFKKSLFPMGVRPYVLAGPEFCFLLSAKAGETDIKDDIKSQDLSATVGAGVELSLFGKGIYVEARYSYGLNNISEDGDQSIKNRVTRFFLGIYF